MRTFTCYDCGYTWQLPHGEGGRGVDRTCPECGSNNVHREDDRSVQNDQRWGRRGRRHGFGEGGRH